MKKFNIIVTNNNFFTYLDQNAFLWPENDLMNWKKMHLVVSHDQEFMRCRKSKLLKLLNCEMIQASSGEVRRIPGLSVGIYNHFFVNRSPMDYAPVQYLHGHSRMKIISRSETALKTTVLRDVHTKLI